MRDKQVIEGAALDSGATALFLSPKEDYRTLKIMTSSAFEDQGGYTPAECIILQGAAIAKLRDFLNLLYPPQQENPDIVAMFKEMPDMGITFTMADDVRVDNDARGEVNIFGKIFYDRGYAVNSEYSNVTGLRKVHITHKKAKA